MSKRGPDGTTIVKKHGITFIHNLLSITGNVTYQPFVQDKKICLFNGEIYNYLSANSDPSCQSDIYNSDGECIIDTYHYHNENMGKQFDGEYCVVLFDYFRDDPKCLLITDTFGTKPLFYAIDKINNRFMISSYARCLSENGYNDNQIIKVPANSTYMFNIKNNMIEFTKSSINHIFNLNDQHKETFEDWCETFEKAVKKRVNHLSKPLFIPMSGGYDSGAICCALNNLNVKYTTYTIKGKEDPKIIGTRLKINKEHGNDNVVLEMNETLISKEYERNMKECSDYECTISNINKYKKYSVFKDRALNGGGFIAKHARQDEKIVCLSGQGADEILSDYGYNDQKKSWHSCFGGKFPNNLETLIDQSNPKQSIWLSFQSGINEGLLMKEESIFGSYGIETRYPFLDKELVQEFLYLKPELKNKWYKSPLNYYLTKNNYPFKPNDKIGLNCLY